MNLRTVQRRMPAGGYGRPVADAAAIDAVMTTLGEDSSSEGLSGLVCGLREGDSEPAAGGSNSCGPADESWQDDVRDRTHSAPGLRVPGSSTGGMDGSSGAGGFEIPCRNEKSEADSPDRSARGWLMAAVWSLCLALSGFSFWQSGAGGPEPPLSPPDLQAAAHAPLLLAGADQADIPPQPHRKLVTRPIEEIRPGMRVIAENPELDEHLPDTLIDPANWRLVSVMREEDHGRFEAERLFPVSWLKDNEVEVGSEVDLNLSEIELHG